MSRDAIAGVVAREDFSCGERLVAFSLASFADRENRARPGTPAAAGRAGLARSRFLEARDRLVRRGLVVVEHAASGRGRASTLWLPFAAKGPWWDGEINAELFDSALGYSHSRGPARLVFAVLAALADEQGVVVGVTNGQLCAASGVADRTYRRARAALLASGEVVLRSGSGGRGNTNRWEIPDPRTRAGAAPPVRGRRVPPPAGARPLLTTVGTPVAGERQGVEAVPAEVTADVRGHASGGGKGGQDRTVSTPKGSVRRLQRSRLMAMRQREARCHCGQLGLRVTGDPFAVSICNCLACQRRTGSAFGMQAGFDADQVEVVGRFSDYSRVSDEPDRKEHIFHFCPECGSQVFYTEPTEPSLIVVSVGSFADPSFPAPTESGYDHRRHPWVGLPDSVQRMALDFDLWRDGAKHLYDAGNYADAAAKGRELIQAHPDQVYLHYNVACCEARAGRAAEAIAALRSAVQAWDGFRDMAITDADFRSIRDDAAFQRLTRR